MSLPLEVSVSKSACVRAGQGVEEGKKEDTDSADGRSVKQWPLKRWSSYYQQ